MAQQKSCSGTQSIINFFLQANTCIYQLTLFIDGSQVINTVPINSGMTPAQIATLLNNNRTGNTTGTFSVQQVGNDLIITINDIVIPQGDAGEYTVTISGTGFPCGTFLNPLPVFLTCTLIPVPPTGGGGGGIYVPPPIVCFKRERDLQGNLIVCSHERWHYGYLYTLVSSDSEKCCYKR